MKASAYSVDQVADVQAVLAAADRETIFPLTQHHGDQLRRVNRGVNRLDLDCYLEGKASLLPERDRASCKDFRGLPLAAQLEIKRNHTASRAIGDVPGCILYKPKID